MEYQLRKLLIFLTILCFINIDAYGQIKKGKVYVLKQWHLLPNIVTTDIEKSKAEPQYVNQASLYMIAAEWIDTGKVNTIISEGCEGKINEFFKEEFNGWSYKSLHHQANTEKIKYKDILTLIPLKLEAKFTKNLETICGDNLKLIKQQQLALSEITGYLNFYAKLKKYEKYPALNIPKRKAFIVALLSEEEDKTQDPIKFAKEKVLYHLKQEKKYLDERNKSFLKTIKFNLSKNPVLIIGGRHVPGLIELFKHNKIEYEIMLSPGYPDNHEDLTEKIRKMLVQ